MYWFVFLSVLIWLIIEVIVLNYIFLRDIISRKKFFIKKIEFIIELFYVVVFMCRVYFNERF